MAIGAYNGLAAEMRAAGLSALATLSPSNYLDMLGLELTVMIKSSLS